MNAIVTSMITNLHAKPEAASEIVDELLYGMVVRIIEVVDKNWIRIQTAYRYEGYCQKDNFQVDDAKTDIWLQEANHLISQSFADVLQEPRIQSTKMMTLVKGSIICSTAIGELDPEWAAVQLVAGEIGYVRRQWLQEKFQKTAYPSNNYEKMLFKRRLAM